MMEILKKRDAENTEMSQSRANICRGVMGGCALAHLPHQLSMHFGHAVDGSRPLDTEVRGWVTRRRWTERSDGAGDKEAQAVLQGQVQHIMKA